MPDGRAAPPADDDDGALQHRLRLVDERFRTAPAKLDRIRTRLADAADPVAYLDACLNEIEPRPPKPKSKPKPPLVALLAPPQLPAVWVQRDSPAWNAWAAVDPKPAIETRDKPGELGRYRPSEFPERQRA